MGWYRSRPGGLLLPKYVPSVDIEIDWAHPLAGGLVSAYVLGSRRGTVDFAGSSAALGFALSPKPVASLGGPAFASDVSKQYLETVTTPVQQLQPPISLFYFGERIVGTPNGDTALIGHVLDSNVAPFAAYQLTLSSANNPYTFFGSGTSWVNSTTAQTVATGLFTVGGRVKSSANDLWLNGSSIASGSGSTGITYTAGHTSMNGNRNNPLNHCFVNSIAGYIYNRYLEDSLMRWLDAEPFAFFRPRARRQYYTASSGTTVNAVGTAATSAAGTVSKTVSVTAIGAAATAAVGTATPGFLAPSALATSAAGSATPSVSKSPTGAVGTTAVGAVTPSVLTGALSGTAGTTTAGIVTPSVSIVPSGAAASTAAGAVAKAASITETGATATTAAGQPTPTVSVNLSGAASTSAAGSATPSVQAIPSGVAATSAVGAPSKTVSITLNGAAAASAAGAVSVSASGNVNVNAVGAAATSSAGVVTPEVDKPLSGATASTAAGISTPSTAITLQGASGTTAAGVAVPSVARPILGTSGTANAGLVGITLGLQSPGLQAASSAGVTSPQVATTSLSASTSSGAGISLGQVTPAFAGSSGTSSAGLVIPLAATGILVGVEADTSFGIPLIDIPAHASYAPTSEILLSPRTYFVIDVPRALFQLIAPTGRFSL